MNYLKNKIMLISLIFFMLSFLLISIINSSVKPQIKLGTSYWLGYGFLYYLNDTKRLNSIFNTVEFNSASEVLRAYRNGVINSLCLTTNEVLNDFRDEDAYTIVMILDVSEGSDVIISKNPIREPSMLKGKRIGLENTALGAYVLKRFLEIYNLKESDVFIIHVEPHEHYKFFVEGTVDAIITYEPTSSRILRDIGGNVIFSSKEMPGEIYDFVLVRRDFLIKNKKIVKDLIDEYFRIIDDYGSNRDFYYDMLSKNYRISKDTVEKILENGEIKILSRQENRHLLLTDDLEKKLRKMEKYFSLKKSIDYSKLLDRTIIRELYDTKTAKDFSEL